MAIGQTRPAAVKTKDPFELSGPRREKWIYGPAGSLNYKLKGNQQNANAPLLVLFAYSALPYQKLRSILGACRKRQVFGFVKQWPPTQLHNIVRVKLPLRM